MILIKAELLLLNSMYTIDLSIYLYFTLSLNKIEKMGCGSSKPKPRAATVSAPQGGLELIPRPQRDTHGNPIRHQSFDLDRLHLQRALGYAAEYLHGKGADVTVVTLGGAVNTILLKTRPTTHDVDFFMTQNSSSEARLLEQAAQVAEAKVSIPLGREWLNNTATLYTTPSLRQELSDAALQQNEIVFRQPGLKVLAAPWLYALCTKLDRLLKSGKRKPYDCADAATYLYRYNLRHRQEPVNYNALVESAAHYRAAINTSVCREVNDQYLAVYRRQGIVF